MLCFENIYGLRQSYSNWTQIVDFAAHVTLKFDGWPRKIMGHLFYTTSSKVYYFESTSDSNWSYTPEMLDLGQNQWIFVRIKKWKIMRQLFYATLIFVHHFKVIGEFKFELQSGNAQFGSKSAIFVPSNREIWQMTLKNNRATLLYCFNLSVSFHSQHWIQTGFTIQKCPIGLNIDFIYLWAIHRAA